MSNSKSFQVYLSDIRTWLFFFFAIRLVGIMNAPLEIGHSWRQAVTNMVTRNFYQNGVDFVRPMIDMAGEKSGIIGAEFPLYNWLTYLMSLGFGYDHWYGRIINLMVSTLGIYCFYRLVWALFNKKVAFSSTIILLVSIWFGFSRKIMPDTFSVSLVLIALFFAYEYLIRGKWFHLGLYFILVSLGILCKLPAIVLLSVWIVLPLVKTINVNRKIAVYISSGVATAIAFYWYFIWVPHLNLVNDFPLFFPRGLSEGWHLLLPHWQGFLSKFYFDAFHSFVAFAVFLVGIFFLIKKKNRLLNIAVISTTLVFLVFAIKTGIVFPTHSYYIIPFVPLMALVAAFAMEKLKPPYFAVVLGIICIEAIANQQHDFFIKDSEKHKLTLEHELDKISNKKDKIIINGGTSPQHIYFANRKGWTNETEIILSNNYLDSVTNLGAKIFIWDKKVGPAPKLNVYAEKDTEHYHFFRLKE